MQDKMVGAPSSSASPCSLRIVSLFQGAVDVLCALGLQNCLAGRSHQCIGPPSVLALPCVSSCDSLPVPDSSSPHCYSNDQNFSDRHNINWDLLQELKPDLVFSHGPSREDKHLPLLSHQSGERKCRVISLQSHTVEDIFRNLETIAGHCGVKEEGSKLVTLLRTQWKSVKQNTPQWADGMPLLNVAFLSCVNPLIGSGYWIPEIISCAGGLSTAGRTGCPSNPIRLEDLTLINPDVVVYLSHSLHVGSLTTELSWLFSNKEWKNLKAIKANRFFLIDANRFFIDSATNVIGSAELMTEILHGFDYGQEGKGFIRWQSLVSSHEKHDDKVLLQCSKFENKLPALGSFANCMDVDKHEVCNSISHDYPKHITNVYEVRKPALLGEGDKARCDVREKPDVWNGTFGISKSKKEDILQHSPAERYVLDRQRGSATKIITPDTVFQVEKAHAKNGEGQGISCHDDWGTQITDGLFQNGQWAELAQISLSPIDSFCVCDQKEGKVDLRSVHSRDFPSVNAHCLSQQPGGLSRVTSSAVYRSQKPVEDSYCDQQLLSKIWAFTESAAEIRSRSMSSTTKQKVFRKSVSLPVSRRSVTGSSANNAVRLSAEIPRKTPSVAVNTEDDKPPEASTSCTSLGEGKWNKVRATHISTAKRQEEKSCPEVVSRRWTSYSVPSSPKLNVIPRISRQIRSLILRSLVDIKYMDCLLLSGGLASSILAEAVPQVHSKGFRWGFTVLAGPAATDRASAAVAAKCKGMQHVIVGEGEKGYAVFLLAKELAFLVETLKTFDPLQVRNLVPIAAALREAKSRGLEHVVTGDGLDELLFRDSVPENDVHRAVSRVLSRSTVLLGEALDIKVVQPFLHNKLVQECKALIRTCGLGMGPTEHVRAILREAFPEVSAASSQKAFNEVDSGMFYVSDYFSSAISASVLDSKAKSIFQKERIRIRDAEHLVYYRGFRKVFKGKVPKGMVRWASRPCSGCGYQLSTGMSWYCLVCGLQQQSQKSTIKQSGTGQFYKGHDENLLMLKGISKPPISNGEVPGKSCDALDDAECEESKEVSSVASIRSAKVDIGHGNKDKQRMGHVQQRSPVSKPVAISAKCARRQKLKPSQEKKPNYWALVGAGSVGMLLLLQLSRR